MPEGEWDDKHKLALEREMLGLYVSGHPLDGVAHLLTAQVDTQIPAILEGDIANDTQVRGIHPPVLAERGLDGAIRALALSLPTRQCTHDKVTALKQVLARHPGTAQVHLRLISGERITSLELDQSLRVTPSSALMGDLKALLGPGCLGG